MDPTAVGGAGAPPDPPLAPLLPTVQPPTVQPVGI